MAVFPVAIFVTNPVVVLAVGPGRWPHPSWALSHVVSVLFEPFRLHVVRDSTAHSSPEHWQPAKALIVMDM